MRQIAWVLGGSGQIGSYLVELLREKNYHVFAPEKKSFNVQFADSIDYRRFLEIERPNEIYHLASKMFAPKSWETPAEYMQVNGMSVLRLLNAVQTWHPKAKVFVAGSAEMFEKASVIQSEDTNRMPQNPYGLSKLLANELVRVYRDNYNLFAVTGILFNTESPRRKDTFFCQKAAKEAVRLWYEFFSTMKFSPAEFGKLGARRDWGWAPEYVEIIWKLMQQEKSSDYCIGTGQSFTCLEFLLECLRAVGLPKPEEDFNKYVSYVKEPEYRVGDTMRAVNAKVRRLLEWEPKYGMRDVARMLVEHYKRQVLESSYGQQEASHAG